jgi:hypothetical protein
MSFSINTYYDTLTQENVVYAYKGSITSEMINSVLESIEERLVSAKEDGKIRKKIYNVLVESLQNLYHHIEEAPAGLHERVAPKFGSVILVRIGDQYRISTGNFVSSHKIKLLKDKIDKINSMTRDELKDMYKFILNHQKLSAKGGGGLGLVDIARKTGNKLVYTFHPVNEDYYFFNLDVFVNEN